MEICPFCDRFVDDFDIHFNISPRCYHAWKNEQENAEREYREMREYDEREKINEALKGFLGVSDEQKRKKQQRINATIGKKR